MIQFNREYVKNLPDSYNKSKSSNSYKILNLNKLLIDDFYKDIQSVFDMVDINKAKGKTLDLYGNMINQARGAATDQQYLYLIRAKIARNLAGGSYQDITNAICIIFDCEPSQIYIVEAQNPCTVEIIVLPLSVILHAGFTTSQTLSLIKSLLPVGVTLETFLFEGTFELASTENITDFDKGFSSYEGSEDGGYLGITGSGENDSILPI